MEKRNYRIDASLPPSKLFLSLKFSSTRWYVKRKKKSKLVGTTIEFKLSDNWKEREGRGEGEKIEERWNRRSNNEIWRQVGQNGDTNPNCRSCGKVVFQMEQTKAEGLVWHKNCFRCVQCSKQLNVDNYESHESTLYCKPHFKELFQPKPVEESDQPGKSITPHGSRHTALFSRFFTLRRRNSPRNSLTSASNLRESFCSLSYHRLCRVHTLARFYLANNVSTFFFFFFIDVSL